MKISARLVVLSIFALIVLALAMAGCSDRVQGEKKSNAKPQVYFVNIPPDGQRLSVNPVVFWVGTDGDGLIMKYRYAVVREDEMGGMGPDEYVRSVLSTADESVWTYLDVTVDEPRTTNEVPAQADLDDPVNRYIPQWIFVQAIDDLGLGSDIVFRLILRNDLPPNTEISPPIDPDHVYINDETAGAIVTGVPVTWEAEDPNVEDSLFEFEWRLLGPYTDQEYEDLLDEHMDQVFVGIDAKVYPFGLGERIIIIDSSYDSTGLVIDSLVILVDTIQTGNFFGDIDNEYLQMDSILHHDSIMVEADTSGNTPSKMLQWSGGWISGTSNVFYDLFSEYVDDSTIVRNFVFWVRCRDQARVADLTPDWTSLQAIQPRYERGVVVVDFSKTLMRTNAPHPDTTKRTWDGQIPVVPQQYWLDVITAWDSTIGGEMVVFNTTDPISGDITIAEDYVLIDREALRVSLKRLLSHKLIILYNDGLEASGISAGGVPYSGLGDNIYTAIDAGVNAWAVMRTPLEGGKSMSAIIGNPNLVIPDPWYSYYFGVQSMVYSGWGYHSYDVTPNSTGHWEYDEFGDSTWIAGRLCEYQYMPIGKRITYRIEDFVGAVSPTGWPDLNIDTVLLRERYFWNEDYQDPLPCFGWGGPYQWGGGGWPQVPMPDTLRALPEVNWASRVYGTELMYLYKSFYGGSHFLGEFWNFDGTPVAHQLDRGLFRTVHFCFTPLAMDPEPMQLVINEVLAYLFNPEQFEPVSSVRYPGAKAEASVTEAREKHLEGIKVKAQTKIDVGLLSKDTRHR